MSFAPWKEDVLREVTALGSRRRAGTIPTGTQGAMGVVKKSLSPRYYLRGLPWGKRKTQDIDNCVVSWDIRLACPSQKGQESLQRKHIPGPLGRTRFTEELVHKLERASQSPFKPWGSLKPQDRVCREVGGEQSAFQHRATWCCCCFFGATHVRVHWQCSFQHTGQLCFSQCHPDNWLDFCLKICIDLISGLVSAVGVRECWLRCKWQLCKFCLLFCQLDL